VGSAEPQPKHREIVANDLRHHLLEWDGGGRTTVLCLHGFLDLSWGFAPIAPTLAAAGYHVVAPDLRGHGDTDRVGAGGYYYFHDYVPDVADLVDQVARERLVLVGHSMGGGVALLYAGTFPDRPTGVVAMEGIHVSARRGDDLVRRTADWVHAVRKARLRGPRALPTLEACAERLRKFDPRCPPDLALFLAERGTVPVPGGRAFKHDPVHVTRGPYPLRLEHFKAFWSAIICPVLLVDAAESENPPPPDMEERVRSFRNVRRATVKGAGHMCIRHQPAETARVVLEFLRGL
jgi:pimeloyl-ACP methyl ester carboxylesterase